MFLFSGLPDHAMQYYTVNSLVLVSSEQLYIHLYSESYYQACNAMHRRQSYFTNVQVGTPFNTNPTVNIEYLSSSLFSIHT